ncbi:hypothetical protein [Pedobacter sp. R20-19]|uniref:hypothetical protein n=1 Tax=Pedobacter sp. R20-19 TaxID=1270196 RepID=UPI0004933923|nr:hypothetical protein [Pedobacter sp. R20-19]
MPNTSLTTSDGSITPQIMQDEGTVKAFQSIAQSTALAVQDAVDNLRNVNTISSTAIGVAMAQMLAVPADAVQYTPIVTAAQALATTAAANFLVVGQNAATILNGFPSK